ncbi:MAG: carbohydrate ABC transporter permease [Nitrososphaerales archaeon]
MESRRWYLLFIPLFAVIGFVVVYPVILSTYISFTTVSGAPSLANYAAMVATPSFWNALNISLLYSLTSTIVAISIGLGLTFILTQEPRGKGTLEVLYILPLAVSPIVVGVLWSPSSVWDDISAFLHFQLHQPFLNELVPSFYFPTMIFSEAWEWSPLIMLVALSVVNGTAKEIYEAADLHGASAFQKFKMITLPTIFKSPVMQFIVVLRFIDAMRAFEIPLAWDSWLGYANTIGSPIDTVTLYLYKLLFSSSLGFPIGVVSAVALTLFAITLIGAAALLRILKAVGG